MFVKNISLNKTILNNKIKQLQQLVSSQVSIKNINRYDLYKNFLSNIDFKKLPAKSLFLYKDVKEKLLNNVILNSNKISHNYVNNRLNFTVLNKHLSSCKINKEILLLLLNDSSLYIWNIEFSAYIFLKLYVKYSSDLNNLAQNSILSINKSGRWINSNLELNSFLQESLTELFENYLYIQDFSLEVFWLYNKQSWS